MENDKQKNMANPTCDPPKTRRRTLDELEKYRAEVNKKATEIQKRLATLDARISNQRRKERTHALILLAGAVLSYCKNDQNGLYWACTTIPCHMEKIGAKPADVGLVKKWVRKELGLDDKPANSGGGAPAGPVSK